MFPSTPISSKLSSLQSLIKHFVWVFHLLYNVILCSSARLEFEKNSHPRFCFAQRLYALYGGLRELVSNMLLKHRAVLVELLMPSDFVVPVTYAGFSTSRNMEYTCSEQLDLILRTLRRVLICVRVTCKWLPLFNYQLNLVSASFPTLRHHCMPSLKRVVWSKLNRVWSKFQQAIFNSSVEALCV
jgi:hypothetical protein